MKNLIYRLRLKYGKKIKMRKNDGETMYIPACMTLSDMMRLGFSGPHFVKPEERPLKDNEWEVRSHHRNRMCFRSFPPPPDNATRTDSFGAGDGCDNSTNETTKGNGDENDTE
ncbi:MAG: hypothetical protein JJU29_24005 [Verrucomicrobia bacterium]|nr:hypothetical protein [Verrucomicrobiota bacterium]